MVENKEDKKSGKEEMKDLKKTVEAHGTLSEKESEEKSDKSEEVSKELLEKDVEKEAEIEETEAEKKKAEMEKEEEEERERRKSPRKPWEQDEIKIWVPKTKLGDAVRNGVIKDINEILDSGKKILEPEIVDNLIDAKTDLILVGQAKGKFGGGKRRVWRQTQRKTKEGNVATFSTMAVVGDEEGHVGIGTGRSAETLPARDKAIRKAKINIIKVRRACADFDCTCNEPHSVPFKVEGKSGSCRVVLIPAPQGTGLVAGGELKKILKFAGIKDVYSKTFGKKRTTFNLAQACIEALKKTNQKVNENQ
ncbi:MAG: 30S ribosomal protein S5 [Candidatus Pacearchaeota archaeon]